MPEQYWGQQRTSAHIIMDIILASTSPFRQALMKRFGFQFSVKAPLFDEQSYKSEHPNLSPEKMVSELARLKGQSLLESHPHSVVISADQVATLNHEILNKPATAEKNIELLKKLSGESHFLLTSFCVFYQAKLWAQHLNTTHVRFQNLSESKIKSYVQRDEPWMCAGGYKIEKSGLSLIEKIETSDPSAIEGLPMMKLCQILEEIELSRKA